MNWAHLHILLNHAPVIGMVIAVCLLVWGLWQRSDDVLRASLIMISVLALVSIAVYFTGEPAEHVIEDLPDIVESTIEEHEDAALWAVIELVVVGLVSLGGLIRFRGRAIPTRFATIILLLSVLSAAIFARTAYLGGHIRHTEIREGTTAIVQGERLPERG
jgi:hypothetical protein